MINTPRVSLATISIGDVIGDASIQATQPTKDRINAVVPRYVAEQSLTTAATSPTNATVLRTAVTWGLVAGSPVIVSQYVAFDGKQRQKQIDYPFVQNLTQSQQLARYDIENAREFGPITLPLKLRWMGYRPGDVVTCELPELGLNGQDILLLQRELSPQDMTVTMTARSETAGKHPFALGQTGTPPDTPSVTGPPLLPVPGTSAWALVGGQLASDNGTTKPVLQVTGSVDSDVVDAIIFEYRTSQTDSTPASPWVNVSTQPPSIELLNITSVHDQTAYDVAISYRKGSGTGDRLILGPAVAGQTAVPWQTGVTGPGKPDDGATVGAPAGTYVGSTLAQDIEAKLQQLEASTNTDLTPPGLPTGLSATSAIAADGTIDLTFTWTANAESDLAYYVLQVALNGGNYVAVNAPKNAYVFHGLQPNTPFTAQVEAFDNSGNPSGFSATYSGTTTRDTVPPAAPNNLQVQPGINAVQLIVGAPADADTVAIRFYAGPNATFANANPIGIVNALPSRTVGRNTQQSSGSTVYYWASAIDSSGNEGPTTGPVAGSTYSLLAADFTPGLYPTQTYASVGALPASTGSGRVVFVSADGKLYRDAAAGWTAQASGLDITDGTLYGSKIVAGTISTAQLAAGAITASKVGILGNNLFPDPQCADLAWWDSAGQTVGAPSQGYGYRNPAGGAGFGWYLDNNPVPAASTASIARVGSAGAWYLYDGYFRGAVGGEQVVCPALQGITPGKYYEVSASLFNGSEAVGPSNRTLAFNIQFFTIDGTYLSGFNLGFATPGIGAVKVAVQFQAPTNAALYRLYWEADGTGAFTGLLGFGSIVLREAATGTLIVDGTIVASKIAASAITADKIAANSITGDKISSSTSLPASLSIGSTGFSLSTVAGAAMLPDGANLVPYSDFQATSNHWGILYNPNGLAVDFGFSTASGLKFCNVTFTATAAGQVVDLSSPGDPNLGFNVTPNSTIAIQAAFGGQNLSFQTFRVWYYKADGTASSVRSADDLNIPGVLGYPTVQGRFAVVPSDAVRARVEWYGYAASAGTCILTCANPMVTVVAPGTTVLPSYNPGPVPDAAKVANANTTLITPGKIQISGANTLSSWIFGGDNTSINGGAIAANTITANKLTIGHRNLNFPSLSFQVVNGLTAVSWPACFAQWIDASGNAAQVSIAPATQTLGAGYWYFYWTEGATSINSTTDPGLALRSDVVCLATWQQGTAILVQNFGGTIIDGSTITTGTVTADRLVARSITSTYIASGTLTANEIGANQITALHIQALSIDTDKITVGGVSTSNLAANAATNVVSAYTDGSVSTDTSGGWVTIQQVSMTTTGGPVTVQSSCETISDGAASAGGQGNAVFRLVRDGTAITSNRNVFISLSTIDTPAAGAHTYYLQVAEPGGYVWSGQHRLLICMENKR